LRRGLCGRDKTASSTVVSAFVVAKPGFSSAPREREQVKNKKRNQQRAASNAHVARRIFADPQRPFDPWDAYESNTNAVAIELSLKLSDRQVCGRSSNEDFPNGASFSCSTFLPQGGESAIWLPGISWRSHYSRHCVSGMRDFCRSQKNLIGIITAMFRFDSGKLQHGREPRLDGIRLEQKFDSQDRMLMADLPRPEITNAKGKTAPAAFGFGPALAMRPSVLLSGKSAPGERSRAMLDRHGEQ
jgi:hypothetical protein